MNIICGIHGCSCLLCMRRAVRVHMYSWFVGVSKDRKPQPGLTARRRSLHHVTFLMDYIHSEKPLKCSTVSYVCCAEKKKNRARPEGEAAGVWGIKGEACASSGALGSVDVPKKKNRRINKLIFIHLKFWHREHIYVFVCHVAFATTCWMFRLAKP